MTCRAHRAAWLLPTALTLGLAAAGQGGLPRLSLGATTSAHEAPEARKLSSFGDFAANPTMADPVNAPTNGLAGASTDGLPGASMNGLPGASTNGLPGASMGGLPAAPMGGLPGASMSGLPGASGNGLPGGLGAGAADELLGMAGASKLEEMSTQIVSGMVESFLHKQKLQKGELDCLVDGTGELAGNVMMVSSRMIGLLQQMLGVQGSGAGPMPGMLGPAGMPAMPGMPPLSPAMPGMSGLPGMPAMPAMPGGSGAGQPDPLGGALAAAHSDDAYGQGSDGEGSEGNEIEAAPEQEEEDSTDTKAKKSLFFFYQQRRLASLGLGGGAPSPLGMGGASMALGASSIVVQLGFSIQQVVSLSHTIVKTCVRGDALAAFKKAGSHMKSVRYVSGHLLANGANVMSELTDALVHYQKHHFKKFGHDVGKALRKVFLSRSNGTLPEGLPGKLELANITSGLLNGFFGSGFFLDITGPGSPLPVRIDLHQCMTQNLQFFQSIWAATLYFFAQKHAAHGGSGSHSTSKGARRHSLRAERRQHDLHSKRDMVQFGTALAVTMMQLPKVLHRCSIGPEEKEMLVDSVKALGSGVQAHFVTPDVPPPENSQMSVQMAKTAECWRTRQWYQFGVELGVLMQGLVLREFEAKYFLGRGGVLRKQLLDSESWGRSSPTLVLFLVPAAFMLLAAWATLQGRRAFTVWHRQRCQGAPHHGVRHIHISEQPHGEAE